MTGGLKLQCVAIATFSKELLYLCFDFLQHCRLAKKFESLLASDSRFEVIGKVTLGLVCLRLKVSSDTVYIRYTNIA